jgi:hypothetical protein
VIAMHALHPSLSALSLLAALGMAACAPSVPANPTWEEDVKPILAANCVRCHRDEQQNGAPLTFRLDVCEDAGAKMGAAAVAGAALARTTNAAAPMPPKPAAPLSDRQTEVLENWIGNGAPCTGVASAAPVFVLLAPVEESLRPGAAAGEHTLAIRYAIEDSAGTLASATVLAVAATGETYVAPEPLRAGAGEFSWALGSMPAGSYELLVALDDGADIRDVRAGTFQIPR